MSDEDPPRRRLSLAERVNEKVVQSQEKRRKRDVLEEEGWEEVAMADRSVAIIACMCPRHNALGPLLRCL